MTKPEVEGGVLFVDKPVGPTSHEVVAWVRWALRTGGVGHCGTLDPGASGLLVVCVGSATKAVRYLEREDKTYRAVIELGARTTTGDADGDVLETAEVPPVVLARAPGELQGMVGTLELLPPRFSSVHVGGRRAHELAREGVDVELAPRAMTVHAVQHPEIIDDASRISATLRVSKGTYVRSLAEELGGRLGVPAHLRALRRVASGALTLDDERTVSGLVARALDPARDGSPRWRIRLDADEESAGVRDRIGTWLRAHVVALVEVLPFPVLRDEGGGDAMSKLGQGQTVGLLASGLVGPGALTAARVAVAGQGGRLLVARVEAASDGDGRILRPERRIWWPPGPA